MTDINPTPFERRVRKRIRKLVDLDKDDCAWVEENYGKGSLSWLLSLLMQKFREAHAKDPIQMMKISAEEVKQAVDRNDGNVKETLP